MDITERVAANVFNATIAMLEGLRAHGITEWDEIEAWYRSTPHPYPEIVEEAVSALRAAWDMGL